MKDWKGNEITVGQTLLKVRVKDYFGGGKVFLLDTNGNHEQLSFITPHGYQWTIIDKAIVEPAGTTCHLSFTDNPSRIPINLLDIWLTPQACEIICIKNISDVEKEYFKVNPKQYEREI